MSTWNSLAQENPTAKKPALNDPGDTARTQKDLWIAAVRKPHISNTTALGITGQQRPQGCASATHSRHLPPHKITPKPQGMGIP